MEGAGELKWDIEPYNGRSSFFTPENYEKYSFKPSLVELWHLSQKQAAPVGVSNTEQKKTSSKTSNTKNPKEVLAAEDDLPMLEPQMAYPCFSSLTETEQKTYVKLMIKFLNFKPHLNQKKEYEHYQFLKVKTSKENAEFLKFLHNSARRFSEEYKWLSPDANLYTRKLLKACQVYVKKYPELYMVHKITSILGGKFIPNLTLNLEKCLLKMGSAKLGKLTFPTAETDLSAKINMANTTAEKAAILHTSVISDANAAKLASKYSPQVVLTSHTLYTLLNNHGPDYKEQWEIPLRVETISSGNTLKKIVFLDSPLPKKELTVKEKSEMYHEVPLDLYLSKKPDIFLKCVELDKDGDLFPKGTEDYSGRQETTYNMDVDFEHDLTELETFGSTEQIVKDSRHFESQELPNSLPVKSTLLEKLEIEKQVICSTNPKRTIDKTSEQSTASADELSLSDSVEMSSLEIFECDESLDFKKHHDERSSSDATIKNKMEIKHVSKILPSGPFDCTGNHSCGMDENQSDSEDDRLVIDFECAMKHKNKVGASPRDFSCITSPPDICTKESEYLPRKPAKTVSKMFDPVGQILKMQKKLLKPDRNKMQKQTPVSPENGPKPPEPTLINPPVFVTLESNQSNSVNRISHLRKSILPINLLASLEEENEYVPLPVGNCTYKLFSLDSMLLLIRSSIHKVCSKRTYKFGRKRVPAYILTKINYQSHYGVELLTENECCQLWTERLLHSSCLLYVGHIDALTSKFFLLEEITEERLKNDSSNFKPASSLNILHHILKWVTDLQDGSYLLSHVSGDSTVCLYNSISNSCRGSYNLHDAHARLPKTPTTLSVPWVPVNPNLLLPYHIHHGRPPCTFPPAPSEKSEKMQVVKDNEAQANNETPTMPATNDKNTVHNTKKNKGKRPNRLKRWKAKQRARKAQAAVQLHTQEHKTDHVP